MTFDLDNIPEELINIASGQVASEKVAKELSSFLQVLALPPHSKKVMG